MMVYDFICNHPALTSLIAVIAVIIVGATGFNEDDWRGFR